MCRRAYLEGGDPLLARVVLNVEAEHVAPLGLASGAAALAPPAVGAIAAAAVRHLLVALLAVVLQSARRVRNGVGLHKRDCAYNLHAAQPHLNVSMLGVQSGQT